MEGISINASATFFRSFGTATDGGSNFFISGNILVPCIHDHIAEHHRQVLIPFAGSLPSSSPCIKN
jgi:hypothetical protein